MNAAAPLTTLSRRSTKRSSQRPGSIAPAHAGHRPTATSGTNAPMTAAVPTQPAGPTVSVTSGETTPPQVRQLIVRLLDGGTVPFRDPISYEIKDGVLYVFQRSQDTTERIGSRQVVVSSTLNVMIPMNRVIRLEDKLVVPKA